MRYEFGSREDLRDLFDLVNSVMDDISRKIESKFHADPHALRKQTEQELKRQGKWNTFTSGLLDSFFKGYKKELDEKGIPYPSPEQGKQPAVPQAEKSEEVTKEREPEPDAEGEIKKDLTARARRHENPPKGSRRDIPGGRRPGVGNLGVKDYPDADRLLITLSHDMKSGGCCPGCRDGKLYQGQSNQQLRYRFSVPIEPIVLEIEKSRCSACGCVFTAELPHDLKPEIVINKATPEVGALSLMLRYGLGLPHTRQEELLKLFDVKFSNSAHDRIAIESYEALLPLKDAFEDVVVKADCVESDDCSTRTIELKQEISAEQAKAVAAGKKEDQVRCGQNSTVFVAKDATGTHILIESGRKHQGEKLKSLFDKHGYPEKEFVLVTDAASKAASLKDFPEKNELGFTPLAPPSDQDCFPPNVVRALCNAHLRDHFIAGMPGFKGEIGFLLDKLVQVFENDRASKALSHNKVQRLDYHQKNSEPLLAEMKRYAEEQLGSNKKFEPNCAAAQCLRYFIKNYEQLTCFLRIKGVPLTTSKAELVCKFIKLHLKNSLCFQTTRGAEAGAFFESLIATCTENDVNPHKYLTAVLSNRHVITSKNAKDWLPLSYEKALADTETLRKNEASTSPGYRQQVRQLLAKAMDSESNLNIF